MSLAQVETRIEAISARCRARAKQRKERAEYIRRLRIGKAMSDAQAARAIAEIRRQERQAAKIAQWRAQYLGEVT